jgi:serine protease Do
VIWTSDGLIVTNNHVARGEEMRVRLRDGARLRGRVVARSREHDLAALRVDARDLPAARVGDSSRVRVGQMVLAAGNPLGLRDAVTAGIVTGAGQFVEGERTRLDDLIQADVALAPGNSGGPLADAEGRVLGINTMIASSGIALAIPSEAVRRFLSPQTSGHTYLGVGVMEAPVPRMGRVGLLLTLVEEGSPADRAGLLQGDVVLGVNGRPVGSGEELRVWLDAWRAGEAVRIEALRGGDPREFVVVPAARAA